MTDLYATPFRQKSDKAHFLAIVPNKTEIATVKTLIVEDEFTSRIVMQNLLSSYGECHVAVTGEEAVDAFRLAISRGKPYGLVCMDIELPGIDGVEAVRQMRAIEEENGILSTYGTKILMATVVESPLGVVRSFHALCDAYFIKPIDSTALLDSLRNLGLIA